MSLHLINFKYPLTGGKLLLTTPKSTGCVSWDPFSDEKHSSAFSFSSNEKHCTVFSFSSDEKHCTVFSSPEYVSVAIFSKEEDASAENLCRQLIDKTSTNSNNAFNQNIISHEITSA